MSTDIHNTDFRKGDSSLAFGKHFLKISLKNPEDADKISKAEFITGKIVKIFKNPIFPIYIDLTQEETKKLNYMNVGYLRVYDYQERPLTCLGSVKFTCENGVICQC